MIITFNKELLTLPCSNVLPEEQGELIELLERELSNANRLGKNGIGLAAPQVGVHKKVAIIRLPNFNINLVNAEIKDAYDPSIFKDEGCLSFPGVVENTIRYQEVHVINNMDFPNKFVATGFGAVAIQHELDHLNQVLFLDRLAPKQQPVIKSKVKPNDPCICGSKVKYKKCCGVNR